jgi:hypothetical protein
MSEHAKFVARNLENFCGCKGCAVKRATKSLQDAIQRVRDLHREVSGPADDSTCSECLVDEFNYPYWPCQTIKALDGKH